MSDMNDDSQPSLKADAELEGVTSALSSDQVAEQLIEHAEFGQEAVTTAAIEGDNPHISAVIEQEFKKEGTPVTTEMLVATLKRLETQLRKDYHDPERITVPVSARTVIHHDFRRAVAPIPNHIAFPRPALMNGKAIQVGTVKVPAVVDREGNEIKAAQKLPVYVAAAPDGSPLRDSNGAFVVIDPQNGAIRQRVAGKGLVPKRSWFTRKWRWFKGWLKSFRFDFKFIKRVR